MSNDLYIRYSNKLTNGLFIRNFYFFIWEYNDE